MSAYQVEIDAAYDLIREKGGELTLRIFTQTSDPNEPWKPGESTSTDKVIHGVFLKYKEELVDGTEIHKEDQKVLVAGKGLTLPADPNGHIIVDGVAWKIIKVKALNPTARDPILYSLQVRK
jgi:hypothetical protein